MSSFKAGIILSLILMMNATGSATIYRWMPSNGEIVATGITTNWGACGSKPNSYATTLLTRADFSGCSFDDFHNSTSIDPAVDMFYNTAYTVDTNVQGYWYYGRLKGTTGGTDTFTFRLIYIYPNGTIEILPGTGSIILTSSSDDNFNVSLAGISGVVPAGAKLGLRISKTGISVMKIYVGDAANITGEKSGYFSVSETPLIYTAPPTVSSIVRTGITPTNATSVDFTATFSEGVTGVDTTDFTLATAGVSGASVSSVSGIGGSYTVTVNTGTRDGTIRLDVIDDDSIMNGADKRLGGDGPGNGNFTSGETYNIDKTPPVVTGGTPSGGNVPVSTQITVDFSETMNQSSAELAFSTSPATSGSFSWSGNTMTYTPSSILAYSTQYTVTVGTGAKDVAGNNLQSPYGWQFTAAPPLEQKVIFIPWIAFSQSGWSTPVQVQNIDSLAADVNISMYDQNGNLVQTQTTTIQPRTSTVFWPPAGPTDGGSAVVNSTQNITAIVNEMPENGNDAMSYSGFARGSKKLYIPWIAYSQSGWYTPIQVQNIDNVSAFVSLTMYDQNGNIVQTQSANIQPNTAAVFWPPAGPTTGGSGVITSTQNLTAIVNEMAKTGPISMSYEGFTSGSKKVFIPFINFSQASVYTPFQVQNIGAADANVDVYIYDSNGAFVEMQNASIPPNTAAVFWPPGASTSSGSVIIESTQDVIAVVNEMVKDTMWGMSYRGFSIGSSQVYVPWIAYGNSGWSTPVFVQNTGTLSADDVAITFYDQNGVIVETRYPVTIPANSSIAVVPPAAAPTAGGSMVITSLQPLAAVVHEIDAPSKSAMGYCWGFGVGIY